MDSKFPRIAAAVVAVALIAPASAGAATRYITPGGLMSGACLTPATACNYARALNPGGQAAAGDTVRVAAGTYNVNAAEVVINRQLTVVGDDNGGPQPVFTGSDTNARTIQLAAGSAGTRLENLDVRSTGSSSIAVQADVAFVGRKLTVAGESACVFLTAPGSDIDGLVGKTSGGPCISASQTNTTLRNLDVTQSSSASVAISAGGSGSTIEDLKVNSAGAGVYLTTSPSAPVRLVLRRAAINAVNYHALFVSGPALVSDSFVRTSGPNFGAVSIMGGHTELRNITALATGANSHAIRVESAPPSMPSDLVARNVLARGIYAGIVIEPGKPDPSCAGIPGCVFPDYVPGTAGRSHSNVGSVIGGVQDLGGNSNAPIGFRNAAGGDYRLPAGSPAIDAGTDDPLNGPLDLDRTARIKGAAPDMGAYEFDSAPSPPDSGTEGGTVPDGTQSQMGGAMEVPDTVGPALGGTRLTNTAFAVTKKPTPVTARTKRGTTFLYTLSEGATLTVTLQRRVAGRRKGARCVRPTRALRKAKRCNRYVAAGKLTRTQTMGGSYKLPFSGRVGSKALPVGNYRATLLATDPAGNKSMPMQLTFRIVRP
jgi:hypothetical protein